jgi:hypothetical protein
MTVNLQLEGRITVRYTVGIPGSMRYANSCMRTWAGVASVLSCWADAASTCVGLRRDAPPSGG